MERKKRSKGSVWEFCYSNKIFGTFGFEIRACGQKLVKFCAHTHTHAAKLVVRLGSLPAQNNWIDVNKIAVYEVPSESAMPQSNLAIC